MAVVAGLVTAYLLLDRNHAEEVGSGARIASDVLAASAPCPPRPGCPSACCSPLVCSAASVCGPRGRTQGLNGDARPPRTRRYSGEPARAPAAAGRARDLRGPRHVRAGCSWWPAAITSQLWWQREWARLRLHHQYPKAAVRPAGARPGWQSWVPSATTAFVLILALALLALALVCAGRGWWLLAGRRRYPLVPTQVAPGVWAPPLSNQLMYALVWPAGSTEPSTIASWVSAAIEVLVVALPAMVLRSVVLERRPSCTPPDAARRLLAVAVVVGAVTRLELQRRRAAGLGHPRAPCGVLRRRRAARVRLACGASGCCRSWPVLPALRGWRSSAGRPGRRAAGVRQRPDMRGRSPSRSASARCGCSPNRSAAAVVRRLRAAWTAMVLADVERKNARLAARRPRGVRGSAGR